VAKSITPPAAVLDRLKRIQKHVGVEPDGLLGVETISAVERALGIAPTERAVAKGEWSLVISRKGLDALVSHEIGSKAAYERSYQWPIWPGGGSGVTVGIGYDLGYHSKASIQATWQPVVDTDVARLLASASGIKGDGAKAVARTLKAAGVRVPYDAAMTVFVGASLPSYAKQVRNIYPGVHLLPADAQAALLSLVYNRGSSITGSRRLHMKNIVDHVRRKDLEAIAAELVAMKVLWTGQGLNGLLRRRDDEAAMVRGSQRTYHPSELIYV
jgi:hypothetical protein